MSFNSAAVATELLAVLNGLSGMGAAQIGAPESVGPRVGSYVTIGGQQLTRKTAGIMQRETRFLCMFLYRVDGAETTAETTLMNLVDAFFNALHADLTLNGAVTRLEASAAAADEPEYQLRSGKEFREYPISIVVTQQGAYTVNP